MTTGPDTTIRPTDSTDDQTMSTVHPPPQRRSVWTTRQKIVRLLWKTAGGLFWILLPSMRSSLLRLFGGTVGAGCRFARNVEITIPWNIRIGDRVQVGERVILYSLGEITLGDDVAIDYRAHLCAGTHDHTDSRFPLLKPPITIGAETFIGIDAYIAPEVTLGARCRVWPRASVYRSFGDDVELRGNPAHPVEPDSEPAS
jgi:putative colanic acid biosynthesis acetyltransferase WcaF